MTTTTVGAARRPYTSDIVALVRRLHGVGWGERSIQQLVQTEHGVKVSAGTIAEWVDPERAQIRRRRHSQMARIRDAVKSGGRLGAGPVRSPEFRLIRMAHLHSLGVAHEQIATVMNFDFPGELITRSHVGRALASGIPPHPYRDEVHLAMRPGSLLEVIAAVTKNIRERQCIDCGATIDLTCLVGRPPVRCVVCNPRRTTGRGA